MKTDELIQDETHFELLNKLKINNQLTKELPKMKKMFGSFIYKNEFNILFGDTNTGKSLFAFQIAFNIANSKSILGFENETENEKVLYIDFEYSEQQLQKRYSNCISENLYRLDKETVIKYYNGVFSVETIKQSIDFLNPTFVVIDNLMTISSGNISKDIRLLKSILDYFNSLKSKGITILLINHKNKYTTGKYLHTDHMTGSKIISNYADSIIGLELSKTNNNTRYFKHLKTRNDELIEKIHIVEISTNEYLHFEYKGTGYEKEHLIEIQNNDFTAKYGLDKLEKDKEIRYTDLVNHIATETNCNNESAKQKLRKAEQNMLIHKFGTGYKIN